MSLFSCWVCAKDQKFRDSDAVINQTIQRSMQPRSQIFSLNDLRKATSSFKDMLGEGAFGPVYKGTLRDGRNIAVKKLSHESVQGQGSFRDEVMVLTAVEHQNLIRLLGGCIQNNEMMIVYEYMPKGSLDKYLFKSTTDSDLDWHARRNIIVGTANGLYYLHEGLPEKIIHRDIKASNILLDENMNPKISDFGLAKLLNLETHDITTTVVGNGGCIAPEYLRYGKLTEKVDIYSFGLLVLQIVTGRKCLTYNMFGDGQFQTLLDLTWKFYQETRLLDLVDARIRDTALPAEDVERVMHIALLCTQEKAELRPDMSSVLSMLRQQSKILEKPTPPSRLNTEEEEDEDKFYTAVENL